MFSNDKFLGFFTKYKNRSPLVQTESQSKPEPGLQPPPEIRRHFIVFIVIYTKMKTI